MEPAISYRGIRWQLQIPPNEATKRILLMYSSTSFWHSLGETVAFQFLGRQKHPALITEYPIGLRIVNYLLTDDRVPISPQLIVFCKHLNKRKLNLVIQLNVYGYNEEGTITARSGDGS